MEAQLEYTIHIAYVRFFARFGANLYAQSALVNKTFSIRAQSEVFKESVLLVRKTCSNWSLDAHPLVRRQNVISP